MFNHYTTDTTINMKRASLTVNTENSQVMEGTKGAYGKTSP